MSDELLLNPKYWRDRAEEARSMAAEMKNKDAADALDQVARSYDRLAEIAAHEKARLAAKAP